MSEVYKTRLEQPKKGSKYYDTNSNPFVAAGYGMFQNGGNCTCYAWGRWYELLGKKPKLSVYAACDWYGEKDGYKRGKTPKLGAVACWKGGSSGDGHIAIVEVIDSKGNIRTSESGWNNYLFKTVKYSKGYKMSGFTFQGFIYPPIDFVKELPKVEEPVEQKVETPTETKKEEQQEIINKYEKLIEKDGIYKIKLFKGETLIIK